MFSRPWTGRFEEELMSSVHGWLCAGCCGVWAVRAWKILDRTISGGQALRIQWYLRWLSSSSRSEVMVTHRFTGHLVAGGGVKGRKMITSKSINRLFWDAARFKSKYISIFGHFHVLGNGHAKTPLSMQWQPRSCNNIPSFLQWTTPIERSFCEAYTWHHLRILVKAPLCCDWKGRAAGAQTCTLWHQATIKIPHSAQLISACSRHMVLFFTHIPFMVNHTFSTTLTERLQYLQQGWARLFETTESERDKENANWE